MSHVYIYVEPTHENGDATSISDGIFRFEIRLGPQLQSTALVLGPNLTLWGKYDTMWVGHGISP